MMLLILDRYVSRVFVAYFFVCLLGGIGLVTVIDIGTRLDDFIKGGFVTIVTSIFRYALWNTPVVICLIFPPLLLISAGWALVQLAKNNELIAIKASGISVYRIIIPLFIGGAVIGLGVAGLREWIIPIVAPRINEVSNPSSKGTVNDFGGMIPTEDVAYHIDSYKVSKREMTNPVFCVFAEAKTIEAARGVWKKDKWVLYDVVIKKRTGEEAKPEREEHLEYELPFKLRPEDLTARKADPGLMSTRELVGMIGRYPTNHSLRVALHSRFTYPLTGVILLLIGLPFVVGFERINRSRILGLGMCFVVCAAYYAVTFLCSSLGNSNHLPADWMAAWIPIILFAAVGIFFFDMIKT